MVGSVLGFIVFNFFFLPPYDTFVIGKPEYVVVLFVNLGISVLISILLGRATERAAAAEARATELRTLQELSRELVVRAPGTDAYREIIGHVLATFGYDAGALFVRDTTHTGGLREEVVAGWGPGELGYEWDPRSPERPPERLPLSVGANNVGLLVLRGARPAPTEAESQVLRAFGDQLALVLERDRLLRTATEADVYRQTERLRQTLLAAVSHDLRSPLAAIKPADAREALFHPFYDLDRQNPRLGKGLGLAIAKGFVVAMKGEIWVEDTPGGGATFAIAVPGSRSEP